MSTAAQEAGPVGCRRRWYHELYVWVLAGMAAGAVVGLAAPGFASSLKVLGEVFVGLLTMLLGPIVFCMVVSGISAVRQLRRGSPPTSRRSCRRSSPTCATAKTPR